MGAVKDALIQLEDAGFPVVDGKVTITKPCVVTKKSYSVTVDALQFYNWKVGHGNIQNVINASPGDREFLISGVSPEGWSEMFHGDDDEEE